MKKQPYFSFVLAGVNLTEFGLKIPSPVTSLEIENSEINSFTSWVLNVTVGGDDTRKVNVAAFEALLYSAAQSAAGYATSSGVPVSFIFGWVDDNGNMAEHLSYQGYTLKFKVSTDGRFMKYQLQGFASLSVQNSMPVLRIPALSGVVQPSAILQALAEGVKATSYYELDIDHNDGPTYVNHGPLTTSFNRYVRGTYSGVDDYDSFPGLLPLSKSYNKTRESAGLRTSKSVKKLSQVLNNANVSPVKNFLKNSLTDNTPQVTSFSFWIDEPTMTQPGVIHYKSNAGLMTSNSKEVLEFGTANTNVFSIQGSYDGVAYNMTDTNFQTLGFSVDGSGRTLVQNWETVNSWSSSLSSVFQSANIINDINALASQFSGDFTVSIPGSLKQYSVAQPVSLVVMSGNTISPVTGVYNIVSVGHRIKDTFITSLKLKRLQISSANAVASSSGIFILGTNDYRSEMIISKTSNIKNPYQVDFGTLYPTFEDMAVNL